MILLRKQLSEEQATIGELIKTSEERLKSLQSKYKENVLIINETQQFLKTHAKSKSKSTQAKSE
jgi:hypothetical protein